ncbi:MAG: gliding motility protein GldL [Sphingobacteriales bacterium]|nr:MAG: gliding motility protein GldL [Sphingobacteriales bacterium]TAF82832.1 MAG: gliding motility protein GldL [Sphingobacteriales bacterium]
MAQKKKFKFTLDTIISWGASVVIIGAMFKILHLPGGSIIIGIGLGTEALLFFMMGFVAQHKEPKWETVYPQLSEDYVGELPNMQKAVKLNELEFKGAGESKAFLPDLKIGDDVVSKIKEGLENFSNKVGSIASSADATITTNEFAGKLKEATAKAGNLNNAFDAATVGITAIAGAAEGAKEYHNQVNSLGKSISALNAVYELELQDSSAHLKSMNKFYANLSLTMQNFNESMEDSKQFKDEVGKLAKNLTSLNAVYGNMLSAMNQPRA